MPRRTKEIISKAISLAEPTSAQSKKGVLIASRLLVKLKQLARTHKLHPKVILGGSFAKGTWLKDSLEIDIFLPFPSGISSKELEREGLFLAKQSLLGQRSRLRYAQHPYVEAFIQGVRINLVPCFETRIGAWKSAADRSPFHTKYMNKHLTQKLKREVRLLKMFMKCVGVYGSEIRVQGFSGYACEILILKYKSLLSTLENVSKWKEQEVVCIEPNAMAGSAQQNGPLVIIDPIDSNRNLGAAISPQKIAQLVLSSSSFLRSPRMKFFRNTRRRVGKFELDVLRQSTIGIILSHSNRSPDVIWGQLKKSGTNIRERLSSEGYEVARSTIASDEEGHSALLYLMVDKSLPLLTAKEGPEYFRVHESQKFIEKNSGAESIAWVGDNGRVKSLRFRPEDSDLKSFLENITSSKTSGIARGLKEDFKNSKILIGDELLSQSQKRQWLLERLQDLVSSEPL